MQLSTAAEYSQVTKKKKKERPIILYALTKWRRNGNMAIEGQPLTISEFQTSCRKNNFVMQMSQPAVVSKLNPYLRVHQLRAACISLEFLAMCFINSLKKKMIALKCLKETQRNSKVVNTITEKTAEKKCLTGYREFRELIYPRMKQQNNFRISVFFFEEYAYFPILSKQAALMVLFPSDLNRIKLEAFD